MSAATCIKCAGRLSQDDFDFTKKLCDRVGKPFTPPKVCCECVLLLVFEPDDLWDECLDEKSR